MNRSFFVSWAEVSEVAILWTDRKLLLSVYLMFDLSGDFSISSGVTLDERI